MPLFVTANLGRHVSTAEFLENVRRLDEHAGRGTVIGFQEIDEDDTPNEHHGLRVTLRDFAFAGWDTRVPIAYGDLWTKTSESVVKAAPGLARLSPARVITAVDLEHRGGADISFLDVHFPRKDPRLLSRWVSVEAQLCRELRRRYAAGRTSVWFADANRVHLPQLHPAERTLAHHGLDWIRCVEHPDGPRLRVTDTGSIPLTIDGHDAQWARVEILTPQEHR